MKHKELISLEWGFNCDKVKWDELSNLYQIAPLGEKSPEHLKNVFSNSRYKCFIYFKDKLIGAGRALSDGADCSYICDIAIHPEYQNYGLVRSILVRLLEFSKEHQKIILYAVPGKDGFYEKVGFRKMTSAMAIFKNQEKAQMSGLIETIKEKNDD